jgi:hypothetical protein
MEGSLAETIKARVEATAGDKDAFEHLIEDLTPEERDEAVAMGCGSLWALATSRVPA